MVVKPHLNVVENIHIVNKKIYILIELIQKGSEVRVAIYNKAFHILILIFTQNQITDKC